MPRESKLQAKIKDYLRDAGCYVFNVTGSSAQQRGTPDLLVCYEGRFLAIEVKLPGEKPTKLQEVELRKVQKAGGVGVVVESIEDLERVLNTWLI